MKHIIEKELKSQGEEIFNSLLKTKDLEKSFVESTKETENEDGQ